MKLTGRDTEPDYGANGEPRARKEPEYTHHPPRITGLRHVPFDELRLLFGVDALDQEILRAMDPLERVDG